MFKFTNNCLLHTSLLHSISSLRLELVVEPWIENLWSALESVFNLSFQDKTSPQTSTPAAIVPVRVPPQTIVTGGISSTRGPSTAAAEVPLTVKTPEIPLQLTSNIKINDTSVKPTTTITTVPEDVQIAIVSDLSDTVNTLLSLEYTDSCDTIVDSSMFQTSMRGSGDQSWKNQHIIVPSTPPSYLNVELKEVCVLYASLNVFLLLCMLGYDNVLQLFIL